MARPTTLPSAGLVGLIAALALRRPRTRLMNASLRSVGDASSLVGARSTRLSSNPSPWGALPCRRSSAPWPCQDSIGIDLTIGACYRQDLLEGVTDAHQHGFPEFLYPWAADWGEVRNAAAASNLPVGLTRKLGASCRRRWGKYGNSESIVTGGLPLSSSANLFSPIVTRMAVPLGRGVNPLEPNPPSNSQPITELCFWPSRWSCAWRS